MTLKTLIFSFLFFIKLYAGEDEIHFSHLTAEDGLSLNAVTKIIQDSRGYLWFGTFHGLNRFDGYNFKTFLPESSNPYSISGHSIWALYEDSKGSIWIGTLDGLNRYDWKTERFYKYKNNPKDPHSISHNYIRSIYEDKSGTLWIGTQNGLDKYNREKDNFDVIKKVYNRLNPDSLNSVLSIDEDLTGNLWLATWDGLTCLQKNGNMSYVQLPKEKNPNVLVYNYIIDLKVDKENKLWVGTYGNGLYKYDLSAKQFIRYSTIKNNPNSISDNYVNTLYEDRLNNLWVGTKGGLNKFDSKRNLFTRILHDENELYSIADNEILSITEDKTGIIWVGSLNGGLSYFSQSLNKFGYFKDKPGSINKLDNNRITSAFLDHNSNLWVGTQKGLKEIKKGANFENGTNQVVDFFHDPKNSNTLSDSYIRTAIEDRYGLIWIGTDVGGLNCYNPVTKKFTIYRYSGLDSGSISNNGVISLCQDHKGNIWAGTWFGVNFFDRKTGKFTRYTDNSRSNTIWVVYEDSKGLIWCGTDGSGLKVFNPASKTFTYFTPDSTNKNNFIGKRIFTIYESHDGMIWIGSTEGLLCYNRLTGKFSAFKKENGLPSTTVNDIIEDKEGYLWITTDKGLSRFDRTNGTFINFKKRNGIKELEFTPKTAVKLNDGTLIFGSRKGLMYFDPLNLKDEYPDVAVVFTDLKIYNKSVPISEDGILKESITNSMSIVIPPGNEMITLEFALLDFYDARKNTFQYKLAGFDTGWIEEGTRNTATYTNLPPGQYTFYVKAKNENGIKDSKTASLNLIILPAYYQTLWFKLFMVFISVCLVFISFQARTQVIERRNKMLEKKVAERTTDLDKTIKELNIEIASKDKFFSIIAHDLRSPFTGLLGLLKYLADGTEEITKDELKTISTSMLQSAEITFDLLENLLNWARIKTGRIDFEPQEISIRQIFEEIIVLFNDAAANKNIFLKSSFDGNLTAYADLNMIKTVLRNLISNAIKFTPRGGEIKITAKGDSKFIKVNVIDNGIGLEEDKIQKLFQIDENVSTAGTENERGSGLGLILCKEFIDLNKGQISVKSKLGEGSEFSFTLPGCQDTIIKNVQENTSSADFSENK